MDLRGKYCRAGEAKCVWGHSRFHFQIHHKWLRLGWKHEGFECKVLGIYVPLFTSCLKVDLAFK